MSCRRMSAWVAIVLCGFPILLGAARGVILEHEHQDRPSGRHGVSLLVDSEYFAAEVALIMPDRVLLGGLHVRRRGAASKLIRPRRVARVRPGTSSSVILPVGPRSRQATSLTVLSPDDPPTGRPGGRTSIKPVRHDRRASRGQEGGDDKRSRRRQTVRDVLHAGGPGLRRQFAPADDPARGGGTRTRPIVSLADRWATWLVALCALLIWFFTGSSSEP